MHHVDVPGRPVTVGDSTLRNPRELCPSYGDGFAPPTSRVGARVPFRYQDIQLHTAGKAIASVICFFH